MFASIYGDSDKIEIPFDSSMIQFEKIVVDDRIMIPFSDSKAVQAAMPFILDNEKNTKPLWGRSDYDNTRLWLYIDIAGDKPTIDFITEIVPPRYTDEQRQSILASASKKEQEDGWSEYLKMMNMIDIARGWHTEPQNMGEIYLHPAELNDKEMGEVMFILAQALREDELQQAGLRAKQTA